MRPTRMRSGVGNESGRLAAVRLLWTVICQCVQMSLLNCLCAAIPARERVITCEEVFELRVPLPDVVSMQTRQPNLEGAGEIPLRRLVKEALRMRPSRIVVGEVRQEECLDLTQLRRSTTGPACRWGSTPYPGRPHHAGGPALRTAC